MVQRALDDDLAAIEQVLTVRPNSCHRCGRLRHRVHLREIVSAIVRSSLTRKQAVAQIANWSKETIDPVEQQRFIETAEAELVSLHEGNFVRYQIRPSEFASWRKVWEAG